VGEVARGTTLGLMAGVVLMVVLVVMSAAETMGKGTDVQAKEHQRCPAEYARFSFVYPDHVMVLPL
jgi:hypothetical protein